MNIAPPNPSASVAALFTQVLLPFLPSSERQSVEQGLPTLALLAHQLGVDVLVAEQQGLPYGEAVKRPEFVKMGRVYYGACNVLQYQLPPAMRRVLNTMLTHAMAGKFEPTRKMLFVIASRQGDPEAALCRFLLWIAVRVNLLVITWNDPSVELRGTIATVERQAEATLRQLLDDAGDDLQHDDFRPLHVLIADAVVHAYLHDSSAIAAMTEFTSELQELLTDADALERVRNLEARSAATLWPGAGNTPLGSQQIADRYPQHFSSPNALEQHRSRLLKQRPGGEPPGDRLIDVLLASDNRRSRLKEPL